MVDAFKTLRQIPGNVGPAGFKTGWPAIVREMEELWYSQPDPAAETRLPPNKARIGLMEEALRWPARYLLDFPKGADALNLWAICKAWRINMEAVLEVRSEKAKAIAKIAEREINERRAAGRKAVASEPANWANKKVFLSDGSAEAKDRIVANALIRLERDLSKRGLVQPKIWVKPSDVSPDKVLSEKDMRDKRDDAAQLIADRLARRT
jgi:hypothetical protein